MLLMLFYDQSSDQLSSNCLVETGNQELNCPQHLRPIWPPLNPMECEFLWCFTLLRKKPGLHFAYFFLLFCKNLLGIRGIVQHVFIPPVKHLYMLHIRL